MMKISMIAALDENRLIASASGIPWSLPRDSRHFREYTADKAMLLGRRTFDEMTGWFTTQRPIVVTRQESDVPADPPAGLTVVGSVEAAIAHARRADEAELVVSGGAQIYELALPFADELVLTEIHGEFDGDRYFPAFAASDWEVVARQHFEADAENSHAMSVVTYRRR
jgi:dihydrofolate reductase